MFFTVFWSFFWTFPTYSSVRFEDAPLSSMSTLRDPVCLFFFHFFRQPLSHRFFLSFEFSVSTSPQKHFHFIGDIQVVDICLHAKPIVVTQHSPACVIVVSCPDHFVSVPLHFVATSCRQVLTPTHTHTLSIYYLSIDLDRMATDSCVLKFLIFFFGDVIRGDRDERTKTCGLTTHRHTHTDKGEKKKKRCAYLFCNRSIWTNTNCFFFRSNTLRNLSDIFLKSNGSHSGASTIYKFSSEVVHTELFQIVTKLF